MATPATAQDQSPLCPIHFPGAEYLGELADGWYLGRLSQQTVRDHRGAALTDVGGRYGLFAEDGGCGQLIGLFASVPAPCPLSGEVDVRIDEAFERCDRGELTELPADLAAVVDAHSSWLTAVEACEFLLQPAQGHALVVAAQDAGFQPDGTSPLARFDDWLFDRAGRLIQR